VAFSRKLNGKRFGNQAPGYGPAEIGTGGALCNRSESRGFEKILTTDFTEFTDGNAFIRDIREIRGSFFGCGFAALCLRVRAYAVFKTISLKIAWGNPGRFFCRLHAALFAFSSFPARFVLKLFPAGLLVSVFRFPLFFSVNQIPDRSKNRPGEKRRILSGFLRKGFG
jgi:hypothetical protein